MSGRFAIALVHYPCVDAAGDVYATSLTNLDAHDIARAACTYGVDRYYIVHPVDAQRDLAEAISGYWTSEKGKKKNVNRYDAMRRVFAVSTIDEAIAAEEALAGAVPRLWVTSAKEGPTVSTYVSARDEVRAPGGTLLLFGTGHGLAGEVMERADKRLEPLRGVDGYNHLSVRSAVSIVLDRLVGER